MRQPSFIQRIVNSVYNWWEDSSVIEKLVAMSIVAIVAITIGAAIFGESSYDCLDYDTYTVTRTDSNGRTYTTTERECMVKVKKGYIHKVIIQKESN